MTAQLASENREERGLDELRTVADYEGACRELSDPEEWNFRYGDPQDPHWSTYANNRAALERITLRPRVLTGVGDPLLSTTLVGLPIALPMVVGPTGTHVNGEEASFRATSAAGTVFVFSALSTSSVRELASAAQGPWLQQVYVYRDRALTEFQVRRAVECGASGIVITVSNTGSAWHHQDARWIAKRNPAEQQASARGVSDLNDGSYTTYELTDMIDPTVAWGDVDWLRSLVSVPVAIKGIQTSDDALLAAEHDVDAVVVSNHGGRSLQGARGSAESLREVVAAVGDQIEVHMDGGIRCGEDVLKALALGARTVWLGRAARWGQVVGGEAGVRRVLEILRDELAAAMALSGVGDVSQIGPELVTHATIR